VSFEFSPKAVDLVWMSVSPGECLFDFLTQFVSALLLKWKHQRCARRKQYLHYDHFATSSMSAMIGLIVSFEVAHFARPDVV
jgi:membrane protease YdiL (CAAX protease family)